MIRMKLDVDSLRVESFETASAEGLATGPAPDDSHMGSCVSACGLCATPDWACLA
jgi:hypothetical protein